MRRSLAGGQKAVAKPREVTIGWSICCFDRRRENPLPVYTRFYVLDETKATDHEKQAILDIIHEKDVPTPELPSGLGQTMVTVSHGAGGCSRRVLKYRHLFRERRTQELCSALDENKSVKCESVSLAGEYFEDENGREISDLEMMDYMAGGGPVIIVGNPTSVTRLGAAGMREAESWSVDTANALAHFFQVVDHIVLSTWYRSPFAITMFKGKGIISSVFPSVESALGILVLLRQLYSSDPKDNLFNRACGAYLRHADHKGKSCWVKAEKAIFNTMLSKPPGLPGAQCPFTVSELLDMFLYGASLIHSRGKSRDDQDKLSYALKAHSREDLVFSFHSSMKYLFAPALTVYPVLKQDFLHWVNNLGAQQADRVNIAALLGSKPHDAKERTCRGQP